MRRIVPASESTTPNGRASKPSPPGCSTLRLWPTSTHSPRSPHPIRCSAKSSPSATSELACSSANRRVIVAADAQGRCGLVHAGGSLSRLLWNTRRLTAGRSQAGHRHLFRQDRERSPAALRTLREERAGTLTDRVVFRSVAVAVESNLATGLSSAEEGRSALPDRPRESYGRSGGGRCG